MADTPANRLAGGPKIYAAALGVSLPALTGDSLTLSNDDVQTISKSGTVSGGDFTIEVIYADGSSETTAAIAYDADAAAIKSALAALDGLAASDLTVTGGPASTNPIVITFGGAYANTPMTLMNVDDGGITGGGSLSIAHTTVGRLWVELVDIVGDYTVKRIHKTTKHRPVFSPHPTGSTTVDVGIDQLSYEIEETDLDAHNTGIATARALKVVTAAGAGQSGQESLLQPLPADIDNSLYQLLAVYNGPTSGGWGMLEHFFCCKRLHDGDLKQGTDVNKIPINWEVFADPAQSYRCSKKYEWKAPATS